MFAEGSKISRVSFDVLVTPFSVDLTCAPWVSELDELHFVPFCVTKDGVQVTPDKTNIVGSTSMSIHHVVVVISGSDHVKNLCFSHLIEFVPGLWVASQLLVSFTSVASV